MIYPICNKAVLSKWQDEYPKDVDRAPKRRKLNGQSDVAVQGDEWNNRKTKGYHLRKHFKNAYALAGTLFRLGGLGDANWNPKKQVNPLVVPCTFSTLKAQRIVTMDAGHLLLLGLCGTTVTAMVKTLGHPVYMVSEHFSTSLSRTNKYTAQEILDAMNKHDMAQAGMEVASLKELNIFGEKASSKIGASKGITNYKLLLFTVANGKYFGMQSGVWKFGWYLLQILGFMWKPGITAEERLDCRNTARWMLEEIEIVRADIGEKTVTEEDSIMDFFNTLRGKTNVKNLMGFIDMEMWWHSPISLMALRFEKENKVCAIFCLLWNTQKKFIDYKNGGKVRSSE